RSKQNETDPLRGPQSLDTRYLWQSSAGRSHASGITNSHSSGLNVPLHTGPGRTPMLPHESLTIANNSDRSFPVCAGLETKEKECKHVRFQSFAWQSYPACQAQ